MIIDFHTHVFPDKIADKTIEVLSSVSGIRPSSDGTALGLSRSMQRAGISLSINLPVLTRPEQTDKVNDSLIQNQDEMLQMGILSFGGMHPGYAQYRDKLHMLAANGVKGIKLHPAYQRTDLDEPAMMRIIDTASECGLVTLLHAGLDIGIPGHDYSSIPMILRILEEVRPQKLVLAHMGGWKNWKAVGTYIAGADVWLDTAFAMGRIDTDHSPSEGSQWLPQPGCVSENDPEQDDYYNMTADSFYTLCKKHGTDRILFGTDCPWADQKAYVDAFGTLPFTQEEQASILGGNAASLLNML